jgi:type I restriction enzyme M protein
MEARIVICNMNKRVDRKNKILFINAKHEVTRKNSQSFLEDNHIKKIASTYNEFNTIDGFSYVASIEEIQQNDYELTISLYANDDIGTPPKPIEISLQAWVDSSKSVQKEYSILNSLIGGGDTDA